MSLSYVPDLPDGKSRKLICSATLEVDIQESTLPCNVKQSPSQHCDNHPKEVMNIIGKSSKEHL